MSSDVKPSANSRVSPSIGTRKKAPQRIERVPVSASVEENSEESRQRQAAAIGGFDKPRRRVDLVVAHDLREKELGMKGRVLRGNPPAGRDPSADLPIRRDGWPVALPQHPSQLPRMFD